MKQTGSGVTELIYPLAVSSQRSSETQPFCSKLNWMHNTVYALIHTFAAPGSRVEGETVCI